jgi:hypothetical protein
MTVELDSPSCGENDKSFRDNVKYASPEGEEFHPSPKEKLKMSKRWRNDGRINRKRNSRKID